MTPLVPDKEFAKLHAQYSSSREALNDCYGSVFTQAELDEIPLLIEEYPEFSPEDMKRIYEMALLDIEDTIAFCLENVKTPAGRSPFYEGTGGAPLTKKSTIQQQLMLADPQRYKHAVFADPDRNALLLMRRLYQGYLKGPAIVAREGANYGLADAKAYNICRPATNIIANTLRNIAHEFGYDLVDGTTATGGHMEQYYKALKARNGRTLHLTLASCPEEVRIEGAKWRAEVQAFYQTTPDDVAKKGLLFPQRLGVYFEQADELRFFWSDAVTADARHAATLDRGRLVPFDFEAMKLWADKYADDCVHLRLSQDMGLPSLDDLMNGYVRRFSPTVAQKAFPDQGL